MDDDHTKVGKKAFPTEPYDGNRMNYENYDMDKLAWSIRKKHDEYLGRPVPVMRQVPVMRHPTFSAPPPWGP